MNDKIKILIAEDEKGIAWTLNLKLIHEGFETKVVSNGKDAVESLNNEKFDLLVLDLMMPELDGFGVLTEIKSKGIKIPVIVSSSLSQQEDILRVKELGAVDFFIKSDMSVAEIVEKIKNYISLNYEIPKKIKK